MITKEVTDYKNYKLIHYTGLMGGEPAEDYSDESYVLIDKRYGGVVRFNDRTELSNFCGGLVGGKEIDFTK